MGFETRRRFVFVHQFRARNPAQLRAVDPERGIRR
jgi:hypothetical protein